MGFYERYLAPPLCDLACATRGIRNQREKVVSRAEDVEAMYLPAEPGFGFNDPRTAGPR